MSINKVIRATSSLAMVLMLASCGGDMAGTPSSNATEPMTGAANAVTDPPVMPTDANTSSVASTSISGRVADGYIQGATVCVDLNNNDSCDTDEPSVVTGVGGSYELSIPANAQDKPIVAAIPAEAIDEDTGDAIGKPLVFIAPADQPEFISPITTLIHQELQSNPSLNIEDAESAVKTILGVSEEDISLFADYVAGGLEEGGDKVRQDKFRFLHDTARVVTSMMKDIETEMESAARSNGFDVVGSDDTQRAIRDIVRREVRELLPDIAKQVASSEALEEFTETDLAGVDSVDSEFDPEKIASALRPEGVAQDVQDRINAVIDRVDTVQADIKQLLTDGVYSMEFDCAYKIQESEIIRADAQPDSPTLNDEADDIDKAADEGKIPGSELYNCEPYYSHVRLNDASDELISQEFYFDSETGVWVEYIDTGEGYSEFVLIDGEWKKMTYSDSGPQGIIKFTSDNSAIINDAEGTLQLKAVTQRLDATEVKKYLLSDVADPAWFDLVRATDMFSSGSQAHVISAKQTLHPYVLFNVQPYADSGEAPCAKYFDNCNVLGNPKDDQFVALQSLREVREAALLGMPLEPFHSGIGPGATMTFMVDKTSDGTLPASGTVKWSFGHDIYVDDTQNAIDLEYLVPEVGASSPVYGEDGNGCFSEGDIDGEVKLVISGQSDLPEQNAVLEFPATPDIASNTGDERPIDEQESDDVFALQEESEDDDSNKLAENEVPHTDADGCADLASQSSEKQNAPDGTVVQDPSALSSWMLVNVDGVEMIEIRLPEKLRFDDDNSDQAMLLAEHEGYVRLGTRADALFIDRVVTFNETAFTLLRSIVETGIAPK